MNATVNLNSDELAFLTNSLQKEKLGWETIQNAVPNIYAKQQLEETTALLEKLNAAYWAISDEADGQSAQEIEGSCEGCMHIDCELDERPCSECCRPDRVDRYEQEDETLADVFPELHGGKDADHEQ